MRVLLFDIDGTLIRSGGAGKAAMEAALRETFALGKLRDGVPYSGRTDPSIGRDLLEIHGIDASASNLRKLHDAYLQHLPAALRRHQGVVLPGVRQLLDCLRQRESVAVGLLTGNLREGARHKLSHFGLWDYFPFGAFADGIHDRNDVARHALKEIETHLGRAVTAADIWIIGDTPLDVKCARAIGARAAAVATGWHSLEELHAAAPDLVLADLSKVAILSQAWGISF